MPSPDSVYTSVMGAFSTAHDGFVPTALAVSVFLFVFGAIGVFLRRNVITVMMCVELMLNAVNLAFIAFSRAHGTIDGQILVFFVFTVAAAEAAVGLAIVIALQRNKEDLDVDSCNLLKGGLLPHVRFCPRTRGDVGAVDGALHAALRFHRARLPGRPGQEAEAGDGVHVARHGLRLRVLHPGGLHPALAVRRASG